MKFCQTAANSRQIMINLFVTKITRLINNQILSMRRIHLKPSNLEEKFRYFDAKMVKNSKCIWL